jgi:hypothetical protein
MLGLFDRRFNNLTQNNPENENRIQHFERIIGLDVCKTGTFYIEVNKEKDNILEVFLKYDVESFDLKKNPIRNLPREINCLIAEYVPSFIKMIFKINYQNAYPFQPPCWSLVLCDDRLTYLKNAKEFYENKTQLHNDTNNRSWSPAITMEKDILYFVSKINYFEYFVNDL